MRYLMIVQYNGLNYNGFQKQNNGNTVQNMLENALKTILREEVSTVGSGRTDSKVSAFMQPVHFDIEKEIDTKKVLFSLNGILPADIKVLSLIESDIHARFDAKQKTYCYKMYVSNIDLPLYSNALKISPNIDFKAMKKFLKLIIGTHDFKGFQASGSETETTVRTIYSAKLKKENQYLNFTSQVMDFYIKWLETLLEQCSKLANIKLICTN